ncbi:MAG: hypothetical protein JO159_01480 [Acidobacteria bacterium]|nr:hypothetical protein [Acidobacteriota bacterium]
MYQQHASPFRFAVWGGIGDIVVATLAILLLLGVNWRPTLLAWNLLGLVDIMAVAITAARSEMAVPGSMHQLDQLPLVLLPTLIVPVVIATHLLMLARLWRTTFVS